MSAHSSQADRYQFFYDTFLPVTFEYGTRYDGCSAADISAYTSPVPGPKPLISKAKSTRELTDFLTIQWPNAKAREALERIKQVICTPDWGPDTLIKVLPDMDVAFFDGRLRSRVQASWQDALSVQSLNIPTPNFAQVLGTTAFDGRTNICYIRLNRYKICSEAIEPRTLMLQTLVHEMIHAWDFLSCARQPHDPIDTPEDWVSGHGWHFRWILNLLDELTCRELGFSTIAYWENYRIASMAIARGNFPF